MKKQILIFLSISIFIFFAFSAYPFTEHVYLNGIVINYSSNAIKIDSSKEFYFISDKVRVVKHIKKKNSIYEEPANLRELKVGQSVTLKVIGKTVHEIIIEEYKK